jgi:predicted  nucleic acid-binding Zn-ribbon protein
MKHIKLFEQYITEMTKDEFMNKMIKNPKTGRAVKIQSILSDPENPLYKRLKAKADELGGGSDDKEIEKLKTEIENEKEELAILQTQLSAAEEAEEDGEDDDDDDYGMGGDSGDIQDDIDDARKTIANLEAKLKEAQ